jgi:hypothetical protein
MVSAYWGTPVLQNDVARWLGTTDFGTPSSRIQRLANQRYSVIYNEGSLANIVEWLAQATPSILFVRTGDLPYWEIDTAHAVIVAGLDREQAILIDPAVEAAYCLTSIGDLILAWSHFDYTYAIVRPIP